MEVGITIKVTKQIVSYNQLEITMSPPVIVSSNTCNQMHVQIKHSVAHLQDFIPTLAGIKYISNNTRD